MIRHVLRGVIEQGLDPNVPHRSGAFGKPEAIEPSTVEVTEKLPALPVEEAAVEIIEKVEVVQPVAEEVVVPKRGFPKKKIIEPEASVIETETDNLSKLEKI